MIEQKITLDILALKSYSVTTKMKAVVVMSLLEDLYSGYLTPAKNFGENSFSGYSALKQSAEQREKELLPNLTEKQLRLYKRIRNDRSDMNNLELERMFVYAFKMGMEFMQDCISK